MLTDDEHAALRAAIDQVCNRESDTLVLPDDHEDPPVYVKRFSSGAIQVTMYPNGLEWNLEPRREDAPDPE